MKRFSCYFNCKALTQKVTGPDEAQGESDCCITTKISENNHKTVQCITINEAVQSHRQCVNLYLIKFVKGTSPLR